MVSTYIIFTILLSVFTYGHALNCYMCYASESSDCHNHDTSTKITQYCNKQGPGTMITHDLLNATEQYCVTAVLTATKLFSQGLVKGCGFFPHGLDICDYMIKTGAALSCKACQTDMCNS